MTKLEQSYSTMEYLQYITHYNLYISPKTVKAPNVARFIHLEVQALTLSEQLPRFSCKLCSSKDIRYHLVLYSVEVVYPPILCVLVHANNGEQMEQFFCTEHGRYFLA